jgi:hypothetical protein
MGCFASRNQVYTMEGSSSETYGPSEFQKRNLSTRQVSGVPTRQSSFIAAVEHRQQLLDETHGGSSPTLSQAALDRKRLHRQYREPLKIINGVAQELVDDIKFGRTVLFLGAGWDAPAGFPWAF